MHRLFRLTAFSAAAFVCALALNSTSEAQTRVVVVGSDSGPAYVSRPRARVGVQGDIGGVSNTDAGFGVGLTGQLGWQHTNLFSTYYQPRFFVGGYVAGNSSGSIAAIYNSFMFNLTLASFFEIGIGPSLDLGVANICRDRQAAGGCDGFGGAFFGTDFRIAFLIAGGARRRAGFDIALQSHPTWITPTQAVTTVTLGFGFQIY